ncbi:WD40 repeat-like protein [Hysterangium stoloniferum]|nr:WD40 repeat-like protein [Hysterangium stoloniferum]
MSGHMDFAKLREENIAKNRALLEQLELKEAVAGLGFSSSKPKPDAAAKPVQSSFSKKRKASEVVVPRRQSSRLTRVAKASETPEERLKREREEETRRVQEETERLAREERERESKRPRHQDLDLLTMGDEMAPSDIHSLNATISACARTSQAKNENNSPTQNRDESELNELKKQYGKVKIVSRAKVTQDRVYCSLYHPEKTKDLIFFGDKHGQLGIWDALAPQEEVLGDDGDALPVSEEGGKIFRLQPHWPATSKSSVSCIKIDPLNAHNIYTSAYDCTIRSISFESGQSREIFALDDVLISSMDILPDGHEFWISDAQGGLSHADVREPKHCSTRYQLADAKIGCVSVNPTHPEALLVSSNNRSLTLWDARKLTGLPMVTLPTPPPSSPADEMVEIDSEAFNAFLDSKQGKGTLMADWTHQKSVSSAYWDPSGSRIVSTSYDDTIRLWNVDWGKLTVDKKAKSFNPFSRLRHNCQTGKWLTILKSQWNQNPDVFPHFTVGNMNHSLNVISGTVSLIRITAVQAVTCSHPGIVARVASGNASGRCTLWA